jgi:hypothetical protein
MASQRPSFKAALTIDLSHASAEVNIGHSRLITEDTKFKS